MSLRSPLAGLARGQIVAGNAPYMLGKAAELIEQLRAAAVRGATLHHHRFAASENSLSRLATLLTCFGSDNLAPAS